MINRGMLMRGILIFAVCGVVLTAFGQAPTVMLDVKPVNRKDNLFHSRSLAISVRSTTGAPINDVKVRWAVIKEAYDLDTPEKTRKRPGQTTNTKVRSKGPPQAYGAEKTATLAPLQAFSFETEMVTCFEGRFHRDPPMPGDSIVGHGVQVIAGGKVIAESYADPKHKELLEKIQSPEAGLPEGLKKKKKKR
jgi:hypothetical protein